MAVSAATADQAMAIEHGMHGADRGRLHIVVKPTQLRADLGRAPARVLTPEPHDQRLDLDRELVGLPVGPAAAVGQADGAEVLVTLKDLVAGLGRDAELAAKDCHLLAAEEAGHNPDAFIHLGTLLPRHFALPQSAEVLPMCPERTVTHLSGRASRSTSSATPSATS